MKIQKQVPTGSYDTDLFLPSSIKRISQMYKIFNIFISSGYFFDTTMRLLNLVVSTQEQKVSDVEMLSLNI